MKRIIVFTTVIVCIGSIFLFSGSTDKSEAKSAAAFKPAYHPDKQFNDYWYNNEAELTRYELKQARYGEVHKGDAVLIFVTEHLSPETLLKAYNEDGTDIPTLKLNFNRRFFTGLYPYSIMSSVFTPVNIKENQHSMKVTFGSQEWCGHTYAYIDRTKAGYNGMSHSYFPNEGDEEIKLETVFLEDEIFTRVRVDYSTLPLGSFEMLPSLTHLRLRHKDIKPYKAEATLMEVIAENDPTNMVHKYFVKYENLDRELEVYFEKSFPHKIVKWKETSTSGFGPGAKKMTTEAVATKTILLDYWDKNALADSSYRKQLGVH